jgi:hypothetical protein
MQSMWDSCYFWHNGELVGGPRKGVNIPWGTRLPYGGGQVSTNLVGAGGGGGERGGVWHGSQFPLDAGHFSPGCVKEIPESCSPSHLGTEAGGSKGTLLSEPHRAPQELGLPWPPLGSHFHSSAQCPVTSSHQLRGSARWNSGMHGEEESPLFSSSPAARSVTKTSWE